LTAGEALVDVEVVGESGKQRARDLMLRHGGHFIIAFTGRTLEALD
jgi:hypothetical protein